MIHHSLKKSQSTKDYSSTQLCATIHVHTHTHTHNSADFADTQSTMELLWKNSATTQTQSIFLFPRHSEQYLSSHTAVAGWQNTTTTRISYCATRISNSASAERAGLRLHWPRFRILNGIKEERPGGKTMAKINRGKEARKANSRFTILEYPIIHTLTALILIIWLICCMCLL